MAEEGSVAADKKLSLLENISKAAAVFGALIAVGQAGTTWVSGYWNAEAARAKAESELKLAQVKGMSDLAESYIKLIIAKDTGQADRVMLLGALSQLKDHPLQSWAKLRYDSIQQNIDALNKAYAAQNEATQRKTEAERKEAGLTAMIAELNVRKELAREDVEQSRQLQQEIRERSAELLTIRATISVQSARLESGATVITRVEQGATITAANADLGAAISALASKVNVDLLMSVFPEAARANVTANVGFLSSAMQEFRISDPRVAAAIIAEIVLETPTFDTYQQEVGRPAESKYAARGYIGLTGKPNYERMSQRLGLGTRLVDNPDDARSPEVAARILCAFYYDNIEKVVAALEQNVPARVRQIVIRPARLEGEKYTELYRKVLARL
jgi:predicted chitinase